jgi:hypothetical protein
MQLIPRYLVNNRINLVSSETGFIVEYRPVYTRDLKVYRGIDNRIQFRLLNADQKPVIITGTPVFVAFDENNSKVLEYFATVTDDGSTRDTRGMFEVTITERDLLDIRQQYLHYNVYIEDNFEHRTLTYSNRNFDGSGTIYIDGRSFPGPKPSIVVNSFYQVGTEWTAGTNPTDAIYAYPGTNGFDALHTVAVYSTGYVGTVRVQATLENQLSGINDWFDVKEIVLVGNETDPVSVNFNGVYNYLRFVFDNDPRQTIAQILVRN